jgi:hypothetical protein
MAMDETGQRMEQNVRAAAAALIRGEDANWELARLTYENTGSEVGQLTQAEWARRVQAESGRKFGATTASYYRRVWEVYGQIYRDSDTTITWHDAYWEIRGTTSGESFAETNAKQTIKNLADVPVEEKLALGQSLMNDPDVKSDLERKFIEEAGKNPALVSRINRTYEEFHPTPTPKEHEAPTDLESLIFTGVGSSIYVRVQQHGEQIQRFQQYLEQRTPDAQLIAVVEENLTTMEKSRDLINTYEDTLRKAIGRDADATFHRLVTE